MFRRVSCLHELLSLVFKAPADLFKAPVDISKAPTDLFRTPADLSKAPVDISKSPTDLFRTPADLFKAPAVLFKAPTDLFRTPVYVPACTNSSDVTRTYLQSYIKITYIFTISFLNAVFEPTLYSTPNFYDLQAFMSHLRHLHLFCHRLHRKFIQITRLSRTRRGRRRWESRRNSSCCGDFLLLCFLFFRNVVLKEEN